jgi:ribosomal protein S18 acetylase RimI-like enzyme
MTAPNVQIRSATPTDIPSIQAIAHQTWFPTYGAILSEEQCRFMLDWMYSTASLHQQFTDGCHFLLLLINDEPTGFAAFEPEGKGVFKLHKIYLLPTTQGLGLGRKLLNAVAERVQEAGGTCLDLNVNRHNNARFFYEKLGFFVLREEDNYIGRNFWMNDYVMRKILPQQSQKSA